MKPEQVLDAIIASSLGLDLDEAAHVYRWDDRKIPSVTDIATDGPPPNNPWVAEAIARGARVDEAVGWAECGNLRTAWGCLEESDHGFFESYLWWRREHDEDEWRVLGNQVQVLGRLPSPFDDEPILYAGTADFVYAVQSQVDDAAIAEEAAKHPDGTTISFCDWSLVVLDDKSWINPDTPLFKHYRKQTAGYAHAIAQATGLPVRRAIRRLTPGLPAEIVWHEDPGDFVAFMAAATTTHWNRRRS